jgi:hypothetical protein
MGTASSRRPFFGTTRTLGVSLLISIAASIGCSPRPTSTASPASTVIHQLRTYEIFDRNQKAFHARFRDQAIQIMARHGFKMVATWETSTGGRTQFVYLLEWPDNETMKQGWARFMADREWAEIKKVTGQANGPWSEASKIER